MSYKSRIRQLYNSFDTETSARGLHYSSRNILYKLIGYVLALYDSGIISQYAYDNYRLLFFDKYKEVWSR